MPSDVFITKPFTPDMDVAARAFYCGNTYIDGIIKGHMTLDRSYGKTFVWLSPKGDIIGYYNLGVDYIERVTQYGRTRIGGSIHINSFALAKNYQHTLHTTGSTDSHNYLSDILLYDCINRILGIRDTSVGFGFVTLCSTPQGYALYKRNDFEELDDDLMFSVGEHEHECISMYLPLDYE